MRAGLLAIVLSVTWMANDEVRGDDNCRIQRFNFNITSEGPWPARMTVKAGKSCGSRRWSFGTITPSRLYLADQARHGKVTLSYPGGYQYSPAAGYVGSDSFTLRLCGTKGAVAELVGIEVGVVSGVINLESSGVEASDWRLRHEQAYHEARFLAACD